MKLNLWLLVSVVLLVLGVAAYVYEGTAHGNWTDPGVYSFVIVLVGFGVFGTIYSQTTPPAI